MFWKLVPSLNSPSAGKRFNALDLLVTLECDEEGS